MPAQIKNDNKSAALIAPHFSKNLGYFELSLFAVLLSAGLLSLGALSFSLSAFFILDVSPEGDLWSVA